jgi:hypothetical protein
MAPIPVCSIGRMVAVVNHNLIRYIVKLQRPWAGLPHNSTLTPGSIAALPASPSHLTIVGVDTFIPALR